MNININKFSFLYKSNKINIIKDDKEIELNLNNRAICIDKTKNISIIKKFEDKNNIKDFFEYEKIFHY